MKFMLEKTSEGSLYGIALVFANKNQLRLKFDMWNNNGIINI